MTDLPHLNPAEARVLGCLIEKQQLTPDVYPLSLNSLQAAANQKSSREPVMALEAVEINRALRSLEEKKLARRAFGSRVERFEQQASTQFVLTIPQTALLALLLLRGPQTPGELRTRTERMCKFHDVHEVESALEHLMQRDDGPFVAKLPREPGKRESRFAHLFCGEPEMQESAAPEPPVSTGQGTDAARIDQLVLMLHRLQDEVASLKERLDELSPDHHSGS